MPRQRLIVLTGLPAAGKSSWAARCGAGVLSSDGIRELLTDHASTQSANPLVFATLRYLVAMRVKAGAAVTVIDTTALTLRERRQWVRLADWLGCDAEAVFFDTPLEECLRRNATRQRVVPEEVMRRFAARLTRPTLAEGFTSVKIVPFDASRAVPGELS
jgi:predicted kinase